MMTVSIMAVCGLKTDDFFRLHFNFEFADTETVASLTKKPSAIALTLPQGSEELETVKCF